MIQPANNENAPKKPRSSTKARRTPKKRASMTGAILPDTVGAVLLVRVLVTGNPKKLSAAKRFDKYETGMAVTRYAELVGDAAQAYRDIVWDRDMGYIELVPADEVDACGADETAGIVDAARSLESHDIARRRAAI